MQGGVVGRGQLLGAWMGMAAAWGALAILVVTLGVEPRGILLGVLALIAVGVALVVSRRHALRGGQATITPGDLRRVSGTARPAPRRPGQASRR